MGSSEVATSPVSLEIERSFADDPNLSFSFLLLPFLCPGGRVASGGRSEWELYQRGQSPGGFQWFEKRADSLAVQTAEHRAGHTGGERGAGVRDVP